MNKIRIILIALLAILAMAACSDDDSDFLGTDNLVASFALDQAGTKYYAIVTRDSIIMSVANNVVFEDVNPVVMISENATINPNPASITDWNTNMEFTVKSYSGASRTYQYVVEKQEIVQEGNVSLLTQADVEEFAALGVTSVDGSLTIGKALVEDTIKSLASLSHLKEVKYELIIGRYFDGEDLRGLENLETASSLTIGSNYSTKMKNLTNVSLPSLKKVNNTAYFLTPSAKTIDLPKLQSVGGDFKIENDSLYTCNIPVLETIGGNFYMWYLKNMKEVTAPSLKELGSMMYFSNTFVLESLDFPKLINMGKFYYSSYSKNALTRINIPELESNGGFEFSGTFDFEEFNMKSLTTVKGNASFYNVKGNLIFDDLTSVEGNLYTPSLDDFSGFGSLASVSGSLDLNAGDNCESFAGLNKLTNIGTNFSITGKTGTPLSSLTGLEGVKTIGGNLTINGLLNLTDLKELSSLSSLGGALEIRNLGITNLSSSGLPASLKAIEKFSILEIPLAELDIRGLGVKSLTLDYLSRFTDYTKVVGDGTVLDLIYVEDCKKVEFVGVTECKTLTVCSNGTRGYGVDITGIKKAASADLYHGRDYLNMLDLEEVTGSAKLYEKSTFLNLKSVGAITFGSTTWVGMSLPALTTVNGDITIPTGYGTNSIDKIDLPKIVTIKGKLTIKGDNTSATYQNTKLENLDGLSTLTKVGAVQIINNQVLTDYTGLKNVFSSMTTEDWVTTNNGYNPTLQDMKDGKFVKN